MQGFRSARRRSRRHSRVADQGGTALSCGLPETPTDVDRLRRQLGVVLARALRAAGRRRRDRGAGHRGGGARSGCRDGALGHVPPQAGRHAVRPGRSVADGEARRRALRLRGLRDGMRDAAHRAERDVGRVAPDAAHSECRALSGQRPAFRHAGCPSAVDGRRSSSRASRSRVATLRPGGGPSGPSPTSCSRTTQTRTSSGATVRSTDRAGSACATASPLRSSSRSASRRRGSGS